jgi:hypothetical protein
MIIKLRMSGEETAIYFWCAATDSGDHAIAVIASTLTACR